MIKAMSAPYGKVKFMPTGGITADNLKEYLDFNKIIACGGSWMVKKELVVAGEFNKIEELTRQAVTKMLGFEVRHVGINCANEDEAENTATAFENMFGMTKKVGNSSIFAGLGVEVMKKPYKGAHGHIAIATNYIERAMYYLEKQGVAFDEDTIITNAKGALSVIYLKDEFGGFAVHLVQK